MLNWNAFVDISLCQLSLADVCGCCQQRLERQSSALEAAEASNRSLLSTLEEDRKTISRLTTDQVRAAGTEKRLKSVTREKDDLRQELDAQIRRATAAESRAKRANARLGVFLLPLFQCSASRRLCRSGCYSQSTWFHYAFR